MRNQYGLLTEVKSTQGKHQQAEHFRYDPRHRLIETQDAEQRRIQLSYDNHDRLTRFTNAQGRQWHYGYNAQHKLSRIARPNHSEEKQQYDRHGNLIQYTDANGVIWQLRYGAFDLLTEKIDGEGNRWQYDYDKDSLKLNKVTNPKGETYRYRFNENGQVAEEIDFADNRWIYTYNDNGTLSTLTDGEGNVSHYVYDSAYNLIRLITAEDTFVYQYDNVGRVISIQSLYSQLQFEYDSQDRIIKETQNGHQIHRPYDDEAQTLTRSLYLEHKDEPITTRFQYNKVGELVALTLPNHDSNQRDYQGQTPHILTLDYDQNGNNIKRTSNHGFIFIQKYNEMDLVVQQRAGREPKHFFDKDELNAAGIESPTFAGINRYYTYDAAINTLSQKDNSEHLTFRLNKNNQIVDVANQQRLVESYQYDECGYLTQQRQGTTSGFINSAYHPNYDEQRFVLNPDIYQKGHKLNRINDTHYRYDNAGRLINKVEIKDGYRKQETNYRWNANNQLRRLRIVL